jgi:hypothetical protein
LKTSGKECNWCKKTGVKFDKNRQTCQKCRSDKYGRNSHYKRKYGITRDDYYNMLLQQDYMCKCCREPWNNPYYQWPVDHNHETGVVRGILCPPCNKMIGAAREESYVLAAGIRYLQCTAEGGDVLCQERRFA